MNSAATFLLAVFLLRVPAEWLALAVAHAIPLFQAPVEIPNTVVGLVAFVVASQTAAIGYLLKWLFDLVGRYAELVQKSVEGAAATASALEEMKTAIQQRRSEHEMERQLERIMAKLETESSRNAPATGRSKR